MAIPWLSVLKMVPWSEVISNAPKVAEGAKKLWTAVSRKSHSAESTGESTQPALSPEAQSIAMLSTAWSGLPAAAVIDSAFLVVLLAVTLREIVAGKTGPTLIIPPFVIDQSNSADPRHWGAIAETEWKIPYT